ncbi:MAG: CPBP family intramembrane glutamic endopeptidase [Bacillota bacterium]|jgi:membrane protease YdiL (CAAX protease family)
MNARKFRDLICVAALAYFIPLLSSLLADAAIGAFGDLDPDGVFAWRFLHHGAQTLLTVVVIAVLSVVWKRPVSEWGLNLNKRDWSMGVFWKFCIGCVVYCVIVAWFLTPPSVGPSPANYPMTKRNVVGDLLFMFTMPGISEELLFRSLAITILARSWRGKVQFPGFTVSSPGVIAAVMFALAHIGFTVFPFKVTYLDPMQLIIAFGFGIFYGVMYDHSKSLLGPILVHNASDGLLAAITYLARAIR